MIASTTWADPRFNFWFPYQISKFKFHFYLYLLSGNQICNRIVTHINWFVNSDFWFSFHDCKYQFRFWIFIFELYLQSQKSIFILWLVHTYISIYISIIICIYIDIFICRYIYIIMHINDADSNTHDIDRYVYKQHATLCL